MMSKEVSWEEMIAWMSPVEDSESEGASLNKFWELHHEELMKTVISKFEPKGFVLLENNVFDSSRFGNRYALPFGGKSTLQDIPDSPFSLDGGASSTVSVVGVYRCPEVTTSEEKIDMFTWAKNLVKNDPGEAAYQLAYKTQRLNDIKATLEVVKYFIEDHSRVRDVSLKRLEHLFGRKLSNDANS